MLTHDGFLMLSLEMAAPSTKFNEALDIVDSARNKIISIVIIPYISSRLVREHQRQRQCTYPPARQRSHKSVRSHQPQEGRNVMKG